MGYPLNSTALRRTKTLWSFGLSERNSVKEKNMLPLLPGQQVLPITKQVPIEKGDKNKKNSRITSLGSVPIHLSDNTVKILKFGTPQTIAIIVLKIEKFDVTVH